MKNNITKILFAGIILSATTFYSCTKDKDDDGTTTSTTTGSTDTTPVVLNITPNYTTEAPQGAILKIGISGTAVEGNKITGYDVTSAESTTSLHTTVSGTIALDTIWFKDSLLTSGTRVYSVTLKGERGTPITKTVTINVLPGGDLETTPTAVPLFAQANGAGSNANFLKAVGPSFTTYSTTTFAANKSDIDIAFYYGNTNKVTLTSPTDETMHTLYGGLDWTGANNTKLYKTTLTPAQFDNIATSNSDVLLTSMADGVATWTSSVNLLAEDNILLFKTSTGKLGLIKVDNVSGTTAVDVQIDMSIISQ